LQRFHIRVRYENTRVQQEVDSDVPLATLLHFIAQALDMPADQHIRLGYSENDEFVLLLSDADLHAAMQNGSRDFVVRLRTGGSSSASSAGTVAESAGITPARLSSDLQHQLFQQKQWAFSAQVREAVHKRAIAIFPGGATFGAANLDKSMPDLFSFLQACCQLHEQWEGFRREQNAAGIAESQLCEWFIEAVIGKFHSSVTLRWHSADPATRQERQPSAFPTLESFLGAVYALLMPGVLGSPSAVLPNMLRDLQGRLMTFPSRRHIAAELHQMRQAEHFIQTHMYHGVSEVPDERIKQFLENNLATPVQADLCTYLKTHHVHELPQYFQTMADFPPLREYSLESILRCWQALDSKPGMGELSAKEFIPAVQVVPPAARTRGKGGEPALGAGGQPATPAPGPSANEITFKVNGVPTSFRQNLASWDDQHDRAREEQRFVAAVYSFPGTCNTCGQRGHLARGCPSEFKLDAGGKSTNPRCYFYTLIPPPVAMQAMSAGRASGTGRASGPTSGRGGRHGTGRPSLVAALEAVVDTNTTLQTRLELMAREQQRDQGRLEQLARQLDQSLGNGKAGVDH
jgi:hypothetical protein